MFEKGKNHPAAHARPARCPSMARSAQCRDHAGPTGRSVFQEDKKAKEEQSKGERKGKETFLSLDTQKQQQFGSVPRVEILFFFNFIHHHETLEIKTISVLANTLVNPQKCRSPGFVKLFFSVAGVVGIQPLRMFLPAGISQRTCFFLCFAGNYEEKRVMNDLFSHFLLHQLALIPFPNLHLHLLPNRMSFPRDFFRLLKIMKKNSIMEILGMAFPLLNQLSFLFKKLQE